MAETGEKDIKGKKKKFKAAGTSEDLAAGEQDRSEEMKERFI